MIRCPANPPRASLWPLLAAVLLACATSNPIRPQDSGGSGGISSTTIATTTAVAASTNGTGAATTTSTTSSPMLSCDPGFTFTSNPITTPNVTVAYTNATGFVYVGLEVTGPGSPTSQGIGITGSGPYTWKYAVNGYASGVLTFTFVKDANNGSPGTAVASCQVQAVVGSEAAATTSSGGGLAKCSDLASANHWPGGTFTCDDGTHNWCAGTGTPTQDCARCCSPSCGVLAQLYGSSASCDSGSNHVCNGSGALTWDCPGGCCGPNIPNSNPPTGGAFGYPVGDKTTSPAGGQGWDVWQVLGDYWSNYGGAHLAEDVGAAGAAYAPVYSVADGVVLVSAPNSSSYVNVILIQHPMPDGSKVCSFYGHLASRTVSPGQVVSRGDQIATVLDQGTNSHLHYFIAPADLCDHIAGWNGGGACGYDGSNGVPGLAHADVAHEPASYMPTGTNTGCSMQGYTIFAPHAFIDAHHF